MGLWNESAAAERFFDCVMVYNAKKAEFFMIIGDQKYICKKWKGVILDSSLYNVKTKDKREGAPRVSGSICKRNIQEVMSVNVDDGYSKRQIGYDTYSNLKGVIRENNGRYNAIIAINLVSAHLEAFGDGQHDHSGMTKFSKPMRCRLNMHGTLIKVWGDFADKHGENGNSMDGYFIGWDGEVYTVPSNQGDDYDWPQFKGAILDANKKAQAELIEVSKALYQDLQEYLKGIWSRVSPANNDVTVVPPKPAQAAQSDDPDEDPSEAMDDDLPF